MQKRKSKKSKKIPDTAQKSIPFETMYPDGVCKVNENFYNRMIELSDVNYELLGEADKKDFHKKYKQLINYFDSEVYVQMLLINRRAGTSVLTKRVHLKQAEDGYDHIREEVSHILEEFAIKETNGIVRTRYLLFGIKRESKKEAAGYLKNMEEDIRENFAKLGVKTRSLNGTQRLKVLYEYFNQDIQSPFHFSYANAAACGHGVKDYIAPPVFDFRHSSYLKLGNMHGSMFYVAMLTENLEDDFLAKMMAVDENIAISVHYYNMDPVEAVKLIRQRLSDVQAMKLEKQKEAVNKGFDMEIMPADIHAYEKDLLKHADYMNATNQKLIWTTFLIGCFGRTKQEMGYTIQKVKGIVEQANCDLRPLTNQQEDAFMSASPIGTNKISIRRNLITDVIAAFVPFRTKELRTGGEELYYGINPLSGNLIFADRKKLKTPNGVVLGKPGSGKSFSGKREILFSFLMTDDHIVVYDPENEYHALVEALGGEIVRLAADSDRFLNPMDIQLSHMEDKDALDLKSDFILTLCDMVAGKQTPLGNDDRGVVDQCIAQIYKKYYENPIPENMPILEDLYNALNKMNDERAKRIADNLYLFVHGSQNYFNHRTNIDVENRIICYETCDLGTQLRDLGMLVVQEAVWNRVAKNREQKRSTRYYCDEVHLLLKERQTAGYIVEMWKRFRKWGGIPTALTQNVADFLRSPEIEGILGNSDFVCLLNQSPEDREILAGKLHLSKEQLAYVTDSEQGCGLLKYDSVVIPFKDHYPKHTKTYAIMTTKPDEAL